MNIRLVTALDVPFSSQRVAFPGTLVFSEEGTAAGRRSIMRKNYSRNTVVGVRFIKFGRSTELDFSIRLPRIIHD